MAVGITDRKRSFDQKEYVHYIIIYVLRTRALYPVYRSWYDLNSDKSGIYPLQKYHMVLMLFVSRETALAKDLFSAMISSWGLLAWDPFRMNRRLINSLNSRIFKTFWIVKYWSSYIIAFRTCTQNLAIAWDLDFRNRFTPQGNNLLLCRRKACKKKDAC